MKLWSLPLSFCIAIQVVTLLTATTEAYGIQTIVSMENLTPQQIDSDVCARIGKISVENAENFSSKQILKISSLKSGMKIKADTVDIARERLKRAYLDRGFIQINIFIKREPEIATRNSQAKTCSIIFKIEEGHPFRIRRIEFMGLGQTDHFLALRATGLNLDQPYNPLQVDSWIRNLNRLGRFEKMEKKDVEITLNEQQHFVDVLFIVKERK